MELSLQDLRELLGTNTQPSAQAPTDRSLVGRDLLIRTVTHTYTGRCVADDGRFLTLDACAWIADSGRWADAIANGTLAEVEPMGDGVRVAVGAIVDITPWAHPLPTVQK